jgi:hypothetical protein
VTYTVSGLSVTFFFSFVLLVGVTNGNRQRGGRAGEAGVSFALTNSTETGKALKS